MPKTYLVAIFSLVFLGAVSYFFVFSTSDRNMPNTASTGTGNACLAEYDALLGGVRENFSSCTAKPRNETVSLASSPKKKKNNTVLIFDSSGSMAAKINNVSKIDQAKIATTKFLQGIDGKDLNLGIVAYGHKGSNSVRDKKVSCAGIEEVYYMGAVDAKVAQGKISSFQPTGWTPISDSLLKAESILSKYPESENVNSIVLISDGEETCGGSPIATAKKLRDSGLQIHINVIGFDVAGKEEKQLQDIANAGGGEYFSAKKQEDLEQALQKHENFMANFDNTIAMAQQTLEDITTIGDTFFTCLMRLEQEKANLLLNMYADKKVRPECQNFVEQEYEKQYNTTYGNIKIPFDEAMKKVKENKVAQ